MKTNKRATKIQRDMGLSQAALEICASKGASKSRDAQILRDMEQTVDDLIFWSFRYFLGRRTIATCHFAECLAKVYSRLDPKIKAALKKEVLDAFAEDDRHREMQKEKPERFPHYRLGHDCDRATWETLRQAILKEGK